MNSANIRISAVQQKVDNRLRAKVNALFGVVHMGLMLLGNLVFGLLGEVFQIPYIQLGANMIYLLGIFYFYFPKKNKIKELYNYEV